MSSKATVEPTTTRLYAARCTCLHDLSDALLVLQGPAPSLNIQVNLKAVIAAQRFQDSVQCLQDSISFGLWRPRPAQQVGHRFALKIEGIAFVGPAPLVIDCFPLQNIGGLFFSKNQQIQQNEFRL